MCGETGRRRRCFSKGVRLELYKISKSLKPTHGIGVGRGDESYLPYRRGEVITVRDEGMSRIGRIRSAGDMPWQAGGMPRIKHVSICFEPWSDQCGNR